MKPNKTKEIIQLLKELKKEHKQFWKDTNDDTSPKIIDDTIKFIKGDSR